VTNHTAQRNYLLATDGIYTWNEQDIAGYQAAHPIGTKARIAFALLLYTAQRRSDVIRMGRQHIRDGVLQVRQTKTGAVLDIPVHAELRAVIDATPGEHLTFITTKTGSRIAATISANSSGHGVTRPSFRRLARRMGSAKPLVDGWPRPDAAPTRSPLSPVMRR
jgi:integrase